MWVTFSWQRAARNRPTPTMPGGFPMARSGLNMSPDAYKLPMLPSLAGGTDYAFGGAWVTAPQSIPGGTIPSVPQQVELYLSQHGGKADPKALYVLEGGGNDILDATGGSPEALGFNIAVGIAKSELLLRQAGAQHFVIPNLFDVGLLPAGQANASFDHTAVVATIRTWIFCWGWKTDWRVCASCGWMCTAS